MSSSDKDLCSKVLHFVITSEQIDYSKSKTGFKLLYRSSLGLSMASEKRDRFKSKLKDTALSPFELVSDNCKFENKEEINSLKALMRNKNIIIQKADKGNIIVITDKKKYIEGVKRAISDSNKFVQLNITPEKYLCYIINFEKKISKYEYNKTWTSNTLWQS